MKNKKGLCFRCEYRAEFFESGRKPRVECGNIENGNYSCYMYKPVLPVVLSPMPGYEDRPRFGPAMICGRECFAGIAKNLVLKAIKYNGVEDGVVLLWSEMKEEVLMKVKPKLKKECLKCGFFNKEMNLHYICSAEETCPKSLPDETKVALVK